MTPHIRFTSSTSNHSNSLYPLLTRGTFHCLYVSSLTSVPPVSICSPYLAKKFCFFKMNVYILLQLHNQGLFLLTYDFPFTTKQSAWAIESHRIHLAPISAPRAPTLRLYSGSCHRLHSQCSALAHGKPWGWNYHSHQQCSIFAFKTQVLKEILTTMHMETTVVPRRFPSSGTSSLPTAWLQKQFTQLAFPP